MMQTSIPRPFPSPPAGKGRVGAAGSDRPAWRPGWEKISTRIVGPSACSGTRLPWTRSGTTTGFPSRACAALRSMRLETGGTAAIGGPLARPEPDFLVDAQPACDRRRLRPNESVLVAHGLAQRRAKVSVVAATDDAEDALLLLDRRGLQDRTEAGDLGRRVGGQATRGELVVDARQSTAGDHAGNVVVPILQPRRRRAPPPQRQCHGGATECPDRPAREGRHQQQHRDGQLAVGAGAARHECRGNDEHREMRGEEDRKAGDGAQAVEQRGEAAGKGHERDQHIGWADLEPGIVQARAGQFRRDDSIYLGHCRVNSLSGSTGRIVWTGVLSTADAATAAGSIASGSPTGGAVPAGSAACPFDRLGAAAACQLSSTAMRPTSRAISDAASANRRSISSGWSAGDAPAIASMPMTRSGALPSSSGPARSQRSPSNAPSAGRADDRVRRSETIAEWIGS